MPFCFFTFDSFQVYWSALSNRHEESIINYINTLTKTLNMQYAWRQMMMNKISLSFSLILCLKTDWQYFGKNWLWPKTLFTKGGSLPLCFLYETLPFFFLEINSLLLSQSMKLFLIDLYMRLCNLCLNAKTVRNMLQLMRQSIVLSFFIFFPTRWQKL